MTLVETFFNVDVLARTFPLLLKGLWITVLLGFSSIVIGSVAGVGVVLARLYAPKPVRLLATAWTDIFRAVPTLIVLIIIYFALPFVGIRFSGFTSACLALSIVFSAYAAEVYRAGIEAIPKGQFEAADALGLPFFLTLRKVVLPQAMRLVIPPTTSNCVSVIKETSLAAFVALPDLLKQAYDAQAMMANPTPLIGAALIYLALLWPLVRLVGYLETRAKAQPQK